MPDLFFDLALLPTGWARNVRIAVAGGAISSVTENADETGSEEFPGIALPGLPNLHSHTFQRGMAGLAEIRGPAGDDFWTWRQVMYRFLDRLSPDDVEAIAAYAFLEMLEGGFTAVGEFHYLHHAPGGVPYVDIAELSARIVAAAEATGIGLTLLPVLYQYGGFGGKELKGGQLRFRNDPGRFAQLVEGSREAVACLADGNVGIAPHSLRAVDPAGLAEILAAFPAGPIHIHAAEQVQEVADCLEWSGQRPVEWLLAHAPVDARWCLIHATHMTEAETAALARSGAVAGLCPITESSLGDGIFNAVPYMTAGGAFGVGTDSNIQINAAGELRTLEYSQRLAHRSRNVLARTEGDSTGRTVYEAALRGGTQALQRKIGAIEAGRRADIVVLDANHPDLAAVAPEHCLDAYLFVAGRRMIDTVIVGGRTTVRRGRHKARIAIERRYRETVRRLARD